MRRPLTVPAADYDHGLFINCPFDDDYRPLFDAIVFVVSACGLNPRSAREFVGSGAFRFENIVSLIRQCRWGIHDISRVELSDHGLPRFNMPLELGLFLGASRFGGRTHQRKACLVLDSDPFRYRAMVSDMSGQEVSSHGGSPSAAIAAIRNWLSDSLPERGPPIPGPADIVSRYSRFRSELPALCRERRIQVAELTYKDYVGFVSRWLVYEAGAERAQGR